MLFAGTSGFSYASWKGRFYPSSLAGSKMLRYYAERLNGVELNGSFYRTPPETTLQKWASEVPSGFRFCLKANRGLTYSAETFDRIGLARIFSSRIGILGEQLGPILLQFPPVRQKNVQLLDSLLTALERPAAVEFRHMSWFDDETYAVLRQHQGVLVVTDEEKWPRAPLVDVSSTAYFRLRRGGYAGASLRSWLVELRSALAAHEQVHVYFRHDPASPALARRLVRLAGTGSEPRSGRPRP
ncbi:MAG TPA: DUF72 domain-containing protein [Candidatus Dormibacteraeota bacterium]|jgi:uncharacterized protein YecE (DUF72 family)|nr:DUF72 domain-containing protein [Candidatus Dormibacteraeota bacterium]